MTINMLSWRKWGQWSPIMSHLLRIQCLRGLTLMESGVNIWLIGAVTQHTTACCSMQVIDITLVKYHFTNITSLRVVQQKHSGLLFKHLILQATNLQRTPIPPWSKEEH
jgi:hypothetical protein